MLLQIIDRPNKARDIKDYIQHFKILCILVITFLACFVCYFKVQKEWVSRGTERMGLELGR